MIWFLIHLSSVSHCSVMQSIALLALLALKESGSRISRHPSLLVQVKRDRKIKRILLSSNAETCMTDLCTELMLKPARGPNNYHIGTNGFWIKRKSRLRNG